MATGNKSCMSSILHRPDSRKASFIPDAGMLRKLVRDRNCRPVLRGILESLLHYLTQNLPKWTTRTGHPDKPESEILVERNTNWPDQRFEASINQTQTSCTVSKHPGEHETKQIKTAESSSKIPEKCWSELQKDKPRDQRAGDLIPRRLTTFQLLQSKFIRSTPKPPMTHQREVGTLSCSRGMAGNVKHCQDNEHYIHKKDRTRTEQGLKRGGSVKDMIAKFATAEQKEKGEKMMMKTEPVKPRLIRRGILLSSLMEKFETLATVCKGSDLKCSHERPSEGSNIEQRVACHESWRQETTDQTVHKQSDRKSVRQQLRADQTTNEQEQRPQQVKVHSNLEEENHCKAEQKSQTGEECPDRQTEGLLKHVKAQVYDEDVKERRSGENGAIHIETSVTKKLKYGHLELLCITSVIESSFPEPNRFLPQVEAQVSWHVATITTSPPVWSTCVDSSPKQYEPSESSHTNLKAEVPHSSLQYFDRESSSSESAAEVGNGRCTLLPETERLSTYTGCMAMENRATEDLDPTKAVTIQRGLPKYVIPRVFRCDYPHTVDDQTDFFPQSAPNSETTTLLPPPPPQLDTSSAAAFNIELGTCPNIKPKEKPTERKPLEKEGDAGEKVAPADINDTNVPQSFTLSEDMTSVAAFEDSKTSAVMSPNIQPERDRKQRPKYTTISYGDPSVRQTYKPKTIRFTDTFTF